MPIRNQKKCRITGVAGVANCQGGEGGQKPVIGSWIEPAKGLREEGHQRWSLKSPSVGDGVGCGGLRRNGNGLELEWNGGGLHQISDQSFIGIGVGIDGGVG